VSYTGTVLTLPERIVAFLEEVDRPLTRGEFIYFLRGPHETSQRVQAGLDDLVQRGRVRKVRAKRREYGPYPNVSYELVKTAPDRDDRSADRAERSFADSSQRDSRAARNESPILSPKP
jgi:hypothetical protein